MTFRAQRRISPTTRLLLIATASLALASAAAASRARPDEACARATRRQQAPTQAPTQTPTSTPSPTPGPGAAPSPASTPAPAQTPSPTPSPTPGPSPAPSRAPSATPAAAAADEDVERIESDLTNVLLSVTDKNRRFITTLRAEDLRLLEDGVPQQITFFQRETDGPLSIALLVDTSASQEKVMVDEREAASAFVRSVLRPGKDSASVISFTGITRLDQPTTGDSARLLAAIDRLKVEYTEANPICKNDDVPPEQRIRCNTAVWDSVALSIRAVLSKTPETTRRAVILLSDGDDTVSQLRIYQAVEYAVRNNTVVYSIGIRDRGFKFGALRKDFLRDISEQTGGRAFFPKDAADLAAAFAQIQQELRSQYLISYTSTNHAMDGSLRKVQIELTDPALRKQNLRLLYRQGYYARRSDR